jgi:hypothetical protein
MITIEAQVINAFIVSVIGGIGAILGAIAMTIRQRSLTRNQVETRQAEGVLIAEKARADGYTLQEKSSAAAIDTLSEIAKTSIVIQQNMVEAVREYTRVNGEHSAQLRGMVTMMDDFAKVLKNVVIGMDDVTGHLPGMATDIKSIAVVTSSLETNIGETVVEQFGPVVAELKTIGTQITGLITEVQDKDTQINTRLTELITKFQEAEVRLMRLLEPVVIQHISELVQNGSPAIKPSSEENKESQPS